MRFSREPGMMEGGKNSGKKGVADTHGGVKSQAYLLSLNGPIWIFAFVVLGRGRGDGRFFFGRSVSRLHIFVLISFQPTPPLVPITLPQRRHDGRNPDKANGSPRGLEVGCVMIGEWTKDCRFLYGVLSSPAFWKVREAESRGQIRSVVGSTLDICGGHGS